MKADQFRSHALKGHLGYWVVATTDPTRGAEGASLFYVPAGRPRTRIFESVSEDGLLLDGIELGHLVQPSADPETVSHRYAAGSGCAPHQWITYLWTDEGWLYLATVIDLYSRRVVGWAMSERMTAKLVCDALQMALWRCHKPRGVIVHSDRGSQYCSAVYRALLDRHGLLCSMSGTGNCYDNACAESFFHTLKVEAIHGERFPTRQLMRETVFEYIEVDYNRTRRHSANGYLSPEAFEAQQVA